MRDRDYLQELVELHRITDAEERQSTWRQGMATLAAAVADQRQAVPLEGYDPDSLVRTVSLALGANLLGDLSWLSGPAAAAAVYELASALPPCEAKRELGRRVLHQLQRADAATFVALATQIALSARRALSGSGLRARVALSLDLPIGTGTRADALALALISRRELSREWLIEPSTGSLPSRRLAARLLERAAREAAIRAAGGDDSGVRVFDTGPVRHAWDRLLDDRESLVWRHVATARGLLSAVRPRLHEEIHRNLDPALGVTEWRRAAASLAASMANRPEVALARCRAVLQSAVFRSDRGIPAAMVFGLPRAAEAQPDAAEELLEELVQLGGLAASEALIDLRRERIRDGFGDRAASQARNTLREKLEQGRRLDDGKVALARCAIDELSPDRRPTLRDRVDRTLDAFVEEGAAAANARIFEVLEAANEQLALLEQCVDEGGSEERLTSFRALRELDLALLESDAAANLLALDTRAEGARHLRPLGDIFQRLTNWLIIHEGNASEVSELDHLTLRMRRLRTLLHLVDADGERVEDRPDLLRQRRTLTAQVLLERVRMDAPGPLRRALCAATARACDALVRMEAVEHSDVVLAAGRAAQGHEDLETMAEASMVPDLVGALSAFAALERAVLDAKPSGRSVRTALDGVTRLAHDLPIASSPRVEALRGALLDYGRALEPIAAAGSLRHLRESAGETAMSAVETASQSLAKLMLGTQRRLGQRSNADPSAVVSALRTIDILIERRLRGAEADLDEAVGVAQQTFQEELPRALARAGSLALDHLRTLPVDGHRRSRTSFPPVAQTPAEAPLPHWMPPSRTLGGFYISRAIGNGAVGSVFVAKRSERRADPRAESFALKVPEYSGAAARTLSEEEFLQLFRQEAGALLSLPAHPNIARFVTFDAGARPKPILVMELVEGPNLDRLVLSRNMDMDRAVHLIRGVAAGLLAMHEAGVAHLDLKPSNVIVRDAGRGPGSPVLVDFGLAGRTLRPGCGTANYGAPEVWGHAEGGPGPATAADVYAFGCLAFELLTGLTLFDETNDLATLTAHLQHDGLPEPVGRLQTDPRTAGLAQIIRRSIRRSARNRVTMKELCEALEQLSPSLRELSWPIAA